jgi:DHA1 family multidrug resistance protein-like MFS transporter
MDSLNILIRDSLFGRLLNYPSKGRFFPYNESKALKDEDLPSPDPQRWIIVSFVGPDDPDIPRNWPTLARTVAGLNVLLLNFSFYAASALFTPSISGTEEAFGATTADGTLGLSLFVIAYGIGPLIVCLGFKSTTSTRNVLIMHVSSFLLCRPCRPSGVRRYMFLAAWLFACSTSERL